MNLLDTLTPTFTPDLSKAKKVTGYASMGDKSMIQFEHWLKKKSLKEGKAKTDYQAAVKSEARLKKELEEAIKEYESALEDYREYRLKMMRARRKKDNRQRSHTRSLQTLRKLQEAK